MTAFPELLYATDGIRIYCGDSLALITEERAALVAADPPYNGVLDEAWDRFDSAAAFIEWLQPHLTNWTQHLLPNGSLFVFCYPRMAARVEMAVSEHFNVLAHIVWEKRNGGAASRNNKEALRSFLPLSERIIFAEPFAADDAARHLADAEWDKLSETLREYLRGEVKRSGVSVQALAAHCGVTDRMIGHYIGKSQWELPTEARYLEMRAFLNANGTQPPPPYGDFHAGTEYLPAEYTYLKTEYGYLLREYANMKAQFERERRYFHVTNADQYGDVWRFNTSCQEGTYHPAQKPLALCLHMLRATCRPGDLVYDPFMGSGTLALAARQLGLRYVGIDLDRGYCETAIRRLTADAQQVALW